MTSGLSRVAIRRYAGSTDSRALEVALVSSSILIWVPYSIAAVYTAYCNSFIADTEGSRRLLTRSDNLKLSTTIPNHTFAASFPGSIILLIQGFQLGDTWNWFKFYFSSKGFDIEAFVPVVIQVLAFSLFAIVCTWILSVRVENGGEFLFVLSWLLGIFSENFWLTSNISASASSSTTHTLSFMPTSASSSHATVDPDSNMFMHHHRYATDPGWMWLVVSITTGFFSGILCKVKDVLDAKVSRGDHIHRIFEYPAHKAVACGHDSNDDAHESQLLFQTRKKHVIGLGERLYMLLPFFTGQWFGFILKNGWRGIVVQTGITVLTLGMVGYCMVSFKLLKQQLLSRGIIRRRRRTHKVERHPHEKIKKQDTSSHEDFVSDERGRHSVIVAEEEYFVDSLDIVEFISRLFTSSFGVVMLVLVFVNVFVTSLAIPFLKALSSLNALVNSVGIVVELIIYEMT
ncbi:unnamed protein product [Phytomonas sp. EM1]|nr:unnamed protein product [Phytomonas sp. EM1]|eukprot:CCW62873.1 unnamed protein product [Phytomonas sp. isolate EM1]